MLTQRISIKGTHVKVERIELFQVAPRWLLCKITAEGGYTGWGEPIVEGKAATVAACVEEMSDFVIGHDARNIEDLFQVLYRGGFYRGGAIEMSAISGIEQALWDIKGKALGVPVYELLGGAVRDKMRMYAWINGETPGDIAVAAKARVEQGYTAIKMNGVDDPLEWIESPATIDRVVAKVAAARDAVGRGVGIGVDFHGRVHRGLAKVLFRALEPFDLMFIEEPVLAENGEAFVELSRQSCIPIATGERHYTRWGFKQLLAQGGVAIVQPDLSHAGGIWECRKIAAMAEAYDVAFAPHCPLGPIALASCLQVDFCTPNAVLQEQSLDVHYSAGTDAMKYILSPDTFTFEAGYIKRPLGPGLGVVVNEDAIREAAAIGHRWRNPVWRNADGCVTEW